MSHHMQTYLFLFKLLSVKKSGKQSGGLISLVRIRDFWKACEFIFENDLDICEWAGENLLSFLFHLEFLWPEPSIKFNNFH